MSIETHPAAAASLRRAPIRGTQSFVGVMTEVWHRPGLTGIELAFRWIACTPLLVYLWLHYRGDAALLPSLLHGGLGIAIRPHILPIAGFLVWWSLFSALSRHTLLRRVGDRTASLLTLFVLTLLRVAAFSAFVAVWFYAFSQAMRRGHIDLAAWSTNPDTVGVFAVIVVVTLILFVIWSLTSWILRLAPVIAAQQGLGVGGALAATFRGATLRSKLIEINLVMGIVKVALLVLAMVFSACPLPFQSVATPDFLTKWWIGVAIFYLVLSDYFHVIRMAAYVRLYQALRPAETP